MILGLDISTSITGICIMNMQKGLVLDEALTLKKCENIYEKAKMVNNRLKEIFEIYQIEKVYIEQPLMNFKFGRTSAHTLSSLHKFNGIVSHYCYMSLNKEPVHLNVTSARKSAGLKKGTKIKHSHTKSIGDKKKESFEYIVATYPTFKHSTTRTGNVKSDAYDRADAIIIARAGVHECLKAKKKS